MSTTAILIDTGPLVALLHRGDPQHAACDAVAKTLRLPLFTCWPVITEAAYLLRRSPQAVSTLLTYCDGSILELLSLDKNDLPAIDLILKKYADQQLDLADAALMHPAARISRRSSRSIADTSPFIATASGAGSISCPTRSSARMPLPINNAETFSAKTPRPSDP